MILPSSSNNLIFSKDILGKQKARYFRLNTRQHTIIITDRKITCVSSKWSLWYYLFFAQIHFTISRTRSSDCSANYLTLKERGFMHLISQKVLKVFFAQYRSDNVEHFSEK